MKIDGARIINDFIEPNKRQYSIPVYQRNYEWSRDQCEKLFEDIVLAFKRDKLHFCGSIVYAPLKTEKNIQYFVIVDGQQRMTTIYILLKALIDSAASAREKEMLEETVFNRDKYDTYDVDKASKLKLKPIKSDNQQLTLLMDGKYSQIDKTSGIWINYIIFKELIEAAIAEDDRLSVKDIFRGVENLTCADIKLDEDDNAQEIFERINSTGIPLSLADQIRNYVLMTDADQEELYEEYWMNIEKLVSKNQMSEFFLDYLNIKVDGFPTEKKAYDTFKKLFAEGGYTSRSMLQELAHYAESYNLFVNGSDKLSKKTNEYLSGLRELKQTTVYLFLFKVFDDYFDGVIKTEELEKILKMLLSYSIRRIICEVPSNSLRGMYKTLYNRVFNVPEHKQHYYDAVVSFMLQMTSRDVMPGDYDFNYALRNNNLFGKHALCRYLLIAVENSGKEKLATDTLTIEHILPQNRNLSTAWQKMLGDNWSEDRDRWVHTLGNLTLTGYNSELGDKPFDEKKRLIEEVQTKVVVLYKDVQNKDQWNADTIQKRAKRLAKTVIDLFAYEAPASEIKFIDPRYKEYTCEDPSEATYKSVNYYDLIGERVIVNNFANMVRSVTRKLYDLDSNIIEQMAKSADCFPGWQNPAFSYDPAKVRGNIKIEGTDIYMISGFSAYDCISFIKALLIKYDLDPSSDFVYSARSNKTETPSDDT